MESQDVDLESQLPRPPREGYDLVGRLMGEAPETGIFRGFTALSSENLLYLQAELVNLEKDWRATQRDNKASPDAVRRARIHNWDELRNSGEDGDEDQWLNVLEIREKLKEYQESLLRHQEILKLAKPRTHALKFLREWMRRETMGNVWLTGLDRDTWSNPEHKDLVCVDTSDSWATSYLVILYHDIIGKRIHKKRVDSDHLRNSVHYENRVVEQIGKVLMTMIGGLFPVVSIVVLHAVNSTNTRLGVLAAVTVFFSLCLSLGIKAKVTEVFGAAAAFAAVLVVFIGTSDSGT